MALGRGFRKDQRRGALLLVRCGSRRKSAGELCDKAPGSESTIEIPQEIHEALRLT